MARRGEIITNTGRSYGKSIGASVITTVLMGLFTVTYDHIDGNQWVFPFLDGFALKWKLIVSAATTITMILLAMWVLSPSDVWTPEQRLN